MITLTPEQTQALKDRRAVKVTDSETGEEFGLLAAASHAEIDDDLEALREQEAWAAMARKEAARVARESPY